MYTVWIKFGEILQYKILIKYEICNYYKLLNQPDLEPVTMSPLLKHVTVHTDWAGSVIVWEHSPPDNSEISHVTQTTD